MTRNILRFLLALIMMVTLVCGCGNFSDNNQTGQNKDGKSESDDSEEDWEYTDLSDAFNRIRNSYESCGDWTYGAGVISSYNNRINPELPLYTINVNPVATDELIEDYANLACAMDQVYFNNKKYRDYIKDNAPYFIEFYCHEEIIYEMKLDGTSDAGEIKEVITDKMQPIKEQVTKELDKFHEFIEGYEGISRDEEGNYYYVIDSANVYESVNEIISSVDTINQYNPIGYDEHFNYNGSARVMGVIDGVYTLYFDEYGGDVFYIGMDEWRSEEMQFASGTTNLYRWIYEFLVGSGTLDNIVEGYSFYYLLRLNPERDEFYMNLSLDAIPEGESHEDICEAIYKCYDHICTAHENYGLVPWSDLKLNIQYTDPEDANFMYENTQELSWDKRLSYDEFERWYMDNSEKLPSDYYELEDDCF